VTIGEPNPVVRTPILRRSTPFSGKESSTASPLIGPATSAGELWRAAEPAAAPRHAPGRSSSVAFAPDGKRSSSPYQRHEVAKHLRKVAENSPRYAMAGGSHPHDQPRLDFQAAGSEIGRLHDVPGFRDTRVVGPIRVERYRRQWRADRRTSRARGDPPNGIRHVAWFWPLVK
jgi:hypothetical protein